MTDLRRVLVLIALAFWLGGFTFYIAVVVPEGTRVLGSAGQGMITRRVVVWMNLAGAIALIPLLWDAWSVPAWRKTRLISWAMLAVGLLVLMLLYPKLDALVDVEAERVTDRGAFRPLHRLYLWVSTVQWAFGLVYIAVTPAAWRQC